MNTLPKPTAGTPGTASNTSQHSTQPARATRQNPAPVVRRSKADSLKLVDRLKRGMMAATMLSFGAFSVAIGAHLTTTAATSSSTNTSTISSTSSSSSSDDGSYLSQNAGSSNIGSSSTSSNSSSGTVGGSSVS